MKEPIEEELIIEKYILANMDKFFAPEDMPLDDDMPDAVQDLICYLEESEYEFVKKLAKGDV